MFAFYLRRGVLAGLLAGLIAGVFSYFVGEPAVDRALLLEENAGAFNEVVGRPMQKLGLIIATAFYGTAVGGIFAFLFFWFRDRLDAAHDWGRSLRLSGALFAGFFFPAVPEVPP